jgi:hypothetical protein
VLDPTHAQVGEIGDLEERRIGARHLDDEAPPPVTPSGFN